MNITKIKGSKKDFSKEIKGLKKVGKANIWIDKYGTKLVELYKKDDEANEYWWRVKIIKRGVSVSSAGYIMVYTRQMATQEQVHRLVAQAWLKDGNEKIKKYEVNHINGDKQENYYKNLEFVTHAQNMQHARDNGLISNPTYKGKYYKKTKELIYPNGNREKMEPEEYINWRKRNGLPIRGWMIQYMYV